MKENENSNNKETIATSSHRYKRCKDWVRKQNGALVRPPNILVANGRLWHISTILFPMVTNYYGTSPSTNAPCLKMDQQWSCPNFSNIWRSTAIVDVNHFILVVTRMQFPLDVLLSVNSCHNVWSTCRRTSKMSKYFLPIHLGASWLLYLCFGPQSPLCQWFEDQFNKALSLWHFR